MTSTIRTFGFEHVASELFWLALIFCHCLFSLFGGINGIIPIAPIGDKRFINVNVEDVSGLANLSGVVVDGVAICRVGHSDVLRDRLVT